MNKLKLIQRTATFISVHFLRPMSQCPGFSSYSPQCPLTFLSLGNTFPPFFPLSFSLLFLFLFFFLLDTLICRIVHIFCHQCRSFPLTHTITPSNALSLSFSLLLTLSHTITHSLSLILSKLYFKVSNFQYE